ncbi:hypothetical protein V9T40_001152 [Parthenolecanium corni]|uniref:Peptidase A2 domain-containing protein n=1 Tax=Parthenolecanium corni TaxID=536013 RepID=A0AAN9TAQ9_9HEMI
MSETDYRIFARDAISGEHLLIDTGADVSVLKATPEERPWCRTTHPLYDAEGNTIETYGYKVCQLDLGLQRYLHWPFIVAKVVNSIIGCDFLDHFHMMPDICEQRLIDRSHGWWVKNAGPTTKTNASTNLIRGFKLETQESEYKRLFVEKMFNSHKRLYVEEMISKELWLIDSGAQDTFIKPTDEERLQKIYTENVQSAAGLPVTIYGSKWKDFDFGFGYKVYWPCLIANVKDNIIGADLMGACGLKPDVQNRLLINKDWNKTVQCYYK